MLSTTSQIKVTRATNDEVISGKVTAAPLVQGTIMQFKASTLPNGNASFRDDVEIEPATGTRGYVLERDVINSTTIPLEQIMFRKDYMTPTLLNDWASARKILECEVEGPDLLVLSGTGAIVSGTPIKAALSSFGGKLRIAQSGEETYGILRGFLAPQIAGNTIRIVVETFN